MVEDYIMLPEFKIDYVEKTARTRSIIISQPVKMKITYFGDGQGYQSVLIDNKTKNAKESSFCYVKKIPFMLSVNDKVYASYIEVQVKWFKISRFRLVVGNTVVYSEGKFEENPEAAVEIEETDFSLLDKKASKKEFVIAGFFIAFSLFLIKLLKIQTEWNAPFKIVFDYLALPVIFLSIFSAIKFPQFFDKQMRGPYMLFSEGKKTAIRIFLSLCFALMVVLYSGAIISGWNTYVGISKPNLIRGIVESSFESGNYVVVKIKTPEKILEIPVDLCVGRSVQKDDKIETAMIMGSLGFNYLPQGDLERGNLNVFLLENLSDGRWVRQENVRSAVLFKGTGWLKSLVEKWTTKCNVGNAASCRLASYYYEEIKDSKQIELLNKSCDGNDPVGCYGLSLIDTLSKEQKNTAVEKIFTICKTHLPTCNCYWEEFKKYIDAKRLDDRKKELCNSGQRWAC